jgi:hypothetical protein
MTIHHLNCGTMHPYFPRLRLLVYCLLVETDDGLILVDTGLGLGDCTQPSSLMRLFMALMRNPRDEEETAVRQVAAMGFDPASPFYEGADPNHPHDVPANWLSRRLIGSQVPRLRALARQHGDQVRLISGHDLASWAVLRSGR